MSATVIVDGVEGAQHERGPILNAQVRTGWVLDIDVTGEADATVLNRAADAILAVVGPMGSSHPYDPTMKSARLVVRPAGRGCTNKLRWELYYQTPAFGGSSTVFIRDSSTMASYQTRFLPGTRKRIVASFESTSNPSHKVTTRSCSMSILRPIRQIDVTAIIYGTDPGPMRDYFGCVNDREWEGKKAGYWLFGRFESDTANYTGSYTVSASAMTKGNEDWSEVDVIVDPLTGFEVPIDETEFNDAMGEDYVNDVVAGNGFVRVGPYPMVNFNDIFLA